MPPTLLRVQKPFLKATPGKTLKRAVAGQTDKEKALKACVRCADWIATFRTVTASAQAVARAGLQSAPHDEATRFLLGKIDLNYVWLQLGVLGHKTGWGDYWEARKSLDAVLKQNLFSGG